MTSIVPFKIIDIKNNKYLYNGKFTEVAKTVVWSAVSGTNLLPLKPWTK